VILISMDTKFCSKCQKLYFDGTPERILQPHEAPSGQEASYLRPIRLSSTGTSEFSLMAQDSATTAVSSSVGTTLSEFVQAVKRVLSS